MPAAPDAALRQLRAVAAASSHTPKGPSLRGAAARPAAVLILFGVLDDYPSDHDPAAAVSRDLDVLLLARAATLRAHPGQIAFPGGRVDPGDADAVAAALREAREETGLDPSGVEVLGALESVPLRVSVFPSRAISGIGHEGNDASTRNAIFFPSARSGCL